MSTINIGAVIKKLRQERGMVQEQVAEYLNVSTQAVSRWETGSALPDITQVPALANLFNCSADMLLGVDLTLKEKHIAEIEITVSNYLYTGKFEEAEKLLRSSLDEYPNSYELMSELAITLETIARRDTLREKALSKEIIVIGEKILSECTDDTIRHHAILRLCRAYCKLDKTEKAKDLANRMPNKYISNEALLGNYILKGTEKLHHMQKQIADDTAVIVRDIMYLNDTPLDDESKEYNTDEVMALYHKAVDILNILCEDGNFGNFNTQLSDLYLRLYYCSIEKKDNDTALKYFKLAAGHAILFDAIPQTESIGTEEYTSLLFRGVKFGFVAFISSESKSQTLLKKIESENLYSRFPSEELDAIKEDLQKSASPAV